MKAWPHQPSPISAANSTTITTRARRSGWPARADHSQAPTSAMPNMARANNQSGAKKISASTMGAITRAVMTRVLSTLPFLQLLTGLAEAALTRLEPGDGIIQLRLAEVGPQRVGEVEFRIGEVPQQEVADALLAAGAYEEVRIRTVTQSHGRAEGCFIGGLELALDRKAARRVQDVPAPAVADSDIEQHAWVLRSERFRFCHAGLQLLREAGPVTDEAHPDAVLVQVAHVLAERYQEQLHEQSHFALGTLPVLAAKGEEGQHTDLAFGAVLDDLAGGVEASPMPRMAHQATGLRPTAVAVHDDGDVRGRCASLGLGHVP